MKARFFKHWTFYLVVSWLLALITNWFILIDVFCFSFCTVSRRALVCESSHSLCGLSRRAQFGVVVLRVLFEPLCSVWLYNFCHGGVDTSLGGVDTGSLSQKQSLKTGSSCVDTLNGGVDTSSNFQEIILPTWDRVSTQSVVVSTHSG
ncbi:hypothetical protein Taro_013321 [Colocasia esculenta]|uniref:Uncharacterized protein n=1 Tax=Colocasia esculenta TaxID=4460 RepID=A0A843UFW0_COLES|nr:hypothetical protein [Colocasia esculenta]